MFRFAIERPVILTVLVLILTLFGLLSIFNVPVQMIPDLDARVVTVSTKWPGASPQDIEKEIVVEQEKYLGRIPGLERMVATASTGSAEIELEFPFSIALEEALLLREPELLEGELRANARVGRDDPPRLPNQG